MATMKKCDRCGAVYDYKHWSSEPNAVKIYKRNLSGNDLFDGRNEYDLCPRCVDELRAFMDAKVMDDARNIST